MNTRTILLSAAALAALNLSSASFLYGQQDPAKTSGSDTSSNTNAGSSSASDRQTSTGSQSQAADHSRMTMSGVSDIAQSDRDQIDRTLAQVVKDAVQPGKFNDLVNCLSRQDRDRIQAQKPDTNQLDQSAKALGDSWKTKFGQDFDISDEKQAFTPFMIMSGESAEARTAGATMGPGASAGSTYGGSTAGASAGISSGSSNTSGTGTDKSASASAGISGGPSASANVSGGTSGSNTSGGTASVSGDTSANTSSSSNNQGQAQQASAQEGQRAHIMVPASHGLPEVTVNLIKEGGDWKLDIPDSIDANQLSQNLQSQLSQAQTNQSKWPSDQARAQAALAHHVLLALEGRTSSAMGTGTGTDNTGTNSNYNTGTGTSGASGTSGSTGTGTSGDTSGTGTNNTGR